MAFDKLMLDINIDDEQDNIYLEHPKLFYKNKLVGSVGDFLDYDKIEKEVSSWNLLKVPVLELVQWFLDENIRFNLNVLEISVTSHNGWNSYVVQLNGQVDKFKIVQFVDGYEEGEIYTDNLLEYLKTLNLDRY